MDKNTKALVLVVIIASALAVAITFWNTVYLGNFYVIEEQEIEE